MNERVRKTIVFAVFIGALFLAYTHFGGKSEEGSRQPAVHSVDRDAPNRVLPGESSDLPEEVAKKYDDLSWGKDPFYHPREPVEAQ